MNGYSLKEVFEDENEIVNGDFSNGTATWSFSNATGSVVNGVLQMTASQKYGRLRKSQNNYYNYGDNIYARGDVKAPQGYTNLLVIGGTWSVPQEVFYSGSGEWESLSVIMNYRGTTSFEWRFMDKNESNWQQVYCDNLVGINLTDLGINQTKNEMDYWYSEYQNLSQGNIIENYKVLGGEVETAWTEFNVEYLQPILNITALYIDLLIDPLGFVSDILGDILDDIVIIPTIG